jgi:trans-aconitate 2-methyltransferase
VPIKWFRKIILNHNQLLIIRFDKRRGGGGSILMVSNTEESMWDAETYHKVSDIQESWAIELLEKIKISESEIVMDAGCGTGRVTKIIANKVKRGKVYAVDLDENMIINAKKNLKDLSNIVFVKSDLSDVKLPEKIDLVFSNAVIHWILDHKKLFTNFWDVLKPGGKLLIQCGGKGNLDTIPNALEKVRITQRFDHYFKNWKIPWNFASSADTIKILNEIGFKDIQANLVEKKTKFGNFQEYILFMKTVVMKPYLSYLPTTENNNQIKNLFIDEFLTELHNKNKTKNTNEKQDLDLELNYVRLNITARK